VADGTSQGLALEDSDLAELLVTFHPLQAFSPASFTGQSSRLFSYSAENCRAATALCNRQPGCATPDMSSEKLPEATEMENHVTVRDLISFFRNPAKYFLERRLGVNPTETNIGMEENEPFDLEGLDRYNVEQSLMEREITTGHMEEFYPVLSAQGRLPHGAVGQSRFSTISRDIRTFVRRHHDVLQSETLPAPDIDLELAGFRLSGQLEGLRSRGLVHYRYTTLKSKDYLKLWIMHLLLQAAGGPDGCALESLLLGKDGAWVYPPVDGARNLLEELLHLYRKGLRSPLHFFPETSWAYAQKMTKDGEPVEAREDAALDAARKKWEGSNYLRGEGTDDYCRLCFSDFDPLDGEFQELSLTIFGPLLKMVRKEKSDS